MESKSGCWMPLPFMQRQSACKYAYNKKTALNTRFRAVFYFNIGGPDGKAT